MTKINAIMFISQFGAFWTTYMHEYFHQNQQIKD